LLTKGDTRKFTQEIRLGASLGDRVDWLLGGYYTHERSSFSQGAAGEDPATAALLGYLIFLGPDPSTFSEYAGFTDWTFHLTDRFDVQLGGRESRISQSAGPEPESGALEPPGAMLVRGTSKNSAFTYLLTPRFKLTPDLMLYARLASGYRAGGPNQNPDPAVPAQYSPDKTENYELGTKGELYRGLLSFDASVYYINWKDVQINLLDANSGLTYTSNGSRAKSQGVEVSLTAKPITGLKLGTWVVWNEAVLTEAFPATSTASGQPGDRLPYSSRFSAHLALEDDFPLAGGVDGFVGTSLSYVGKRFGTFVSSGPRQTYPGYAQADLRAGAHYESWTVNLFLNNVTDQRGILGGGIGAFPPFGFTLIQPRTIGASVSKSF
jgi:iron complex outermembrane recepter protein